MGYRMEEEVIYQAECLECAWRGDYTDARDVANRERVAHESGRGHFVRIVELIS